MKKIIFFLLVLISLKGIAQDSSTRKISVTLTTKDWNYLGSFVFANDDVYGDLFDSLKVKYRTGSDPGDANNNLTITGQTIALWLFIDRTLRNDPVAVLNNVFKRVNDQLLTITAETFLISGLANLDAEDQAIYIARRQFGKLKNRKS